MEKGAYEMIKKWPPILLAACVLFSACGQNDHDKTAVGLAETTREHETIVGLTEMVREYETMPYEEFKARTGAVLYYGTCFIGEIPHSSLCVVYGGTYNQEAAAAVLGDNDRPIRIEGPLGALMDGIQEEMSLTEFAGAVSADGGAEATFELLEGGGTAYYVGNQYALMQLESGADGELHRFLLISLDQSPGETVGPESIAWLELL